MGNRDDGFGSGFGFGGGFGASGDPHSPWEGGPAATRGVGREPSRLRRHPNEDMGGSNWSGASGRGGMSPSERGSYGQGQYGQRQYGQSHWGPREHGGFSNYGGDRDQDMRRFSQRDRDERDYGESGGREGSWYQYGQYGGGRGQFDRMGMSTERGEHEWSPTLDRRYGSSSEGGWIEQPWRGSGTDMGLAERDDEERGPYYGKGPKGYKRSDERIREEVCEVISRQGFIDASEVEVIVETGILRLVGTVPQRHDKRALEQMAERVHGVEEVRNELRLKRDEQREGRLGDLARQQPHNGKNARS